MIKSAYIHIPFCNTICSYCDFCKVYYQSKLVPDYLEALDKEITTYYKNEELETLYIGGGTPSALSIEELQNLLKILSRFRLSKSYEYTIECNIESITEEKIKLFAAFGINRISIGVQTFQKRHLSFLNRHHSQKEVFEKVEMVKKYIKNINADFIYAIPTETLEELEDDLHNFLLLDIPHISTYSLIIEEHTVLHNKKIEPIEEDLDYQMYQLIEKKLNHYHHYEISNFSLPGYESRHNLTYWNNEEYYGFGVGASGYVNKIRYTNTKSIQRYMKEFKKIESYSVSLKEQIENEFMLGFRKLDGISISHFKNKFGISPISFQTIQKLIEEKKLELDNDNLRISKKYLYISNEILLTLIDFQEDF